MIPAAILIYNSHSTLVGANLLVPVKKISTNEKSKRIESMRYDVRDIKEVSVLENPGSKLLIFGTNIRNIGFRLLRKDADGFITPFEKKLDEENQPISRFGKSFETTDYNVERFSGYVVVSLPKKLEKNILLVTYRDETYKAVALSL